MRTLLLLPLQPRYIAFTAVVLISALLLFDEVELYPSIYVVILLVAFGALAIIGTMDLLQTRHAVLRNYPLTAHIRFILEEIRPEIRQYFLESEKDGTPFSRDKRAIVYQRAKQALDKRPFGTQNDVYAPGYEWLQHSMAPKRANHEHFRVNVGGPGLRAALCGLDLQHFGDEFRRAQPQCHPRAQHRRQEGRLRPRHRRGRLELVPSRERRRRHLGGRLRLFRLPQRRRHVLRRQIRRDRAATTRSRWWS